MLRTLVCLACAAPLLTAGPRRSSLRNMSEAFQELARKVSPAVVKVLVTGYGPVSDEAKHGEAIRLEVLRGSRKLSLEVPLIEQQQHDLDDLTGLADPGKSLVPALGILGVEVSGKIAEMIEDLRIRSGVLVVGRAADAAVESGLEPGDVIHSLNGAAIETLDGLRTALARLKPGDAVALHVEREGRLVYLGFELE